MLLCGAMLLRLLLSGTYTYYVVEVMQYLLYPSAIFLVVVGLWFVAVGIRSQARGAQQPSEPVDDDRHEGHGAPAIAYALVLPILAVAFIPSTPLGAYSAAREGNSAAAPSAETLQALAASPVEPGTEMAVQEFVVSAVWNDGKGIRNRPVSLTGFVTPDPAGGWWIARLSIACCAGDAQPAKVKVLDAPDLPADSWVTVTGEWVPGGTTRDPAAIPEIRAQSVETIPPPANPYEEPFR